MLDIENGRKIIKEFVQKLPDTPGVYRMVDINGDYLYVGKAKALNKRVINYTHIDKLPYRLQRMVSLTSRMEFDNTETEAEALLLEANLIKKLKPRYNILLRDDKSFPYIILTGDHDFPQISKHRGKQSRLGKYYGPFASVKSVNDVLDILQKVFKLRNCSDNIFKNRTRPCLQYQIKRCTAPCVKLISKPDYNQQIKMALDFLNGKNSNVQKYFAQKMGLASDNLEFEKAAEYRDQINALTHVQNQQNIHEHGIKDADIFVITKIDNKSSIHVNFYRNGQNYGGRSFFPRHDKEDSKQDILSSFISQFYTNKIIPKLIYTNLNINNQDLLEEALATKINIPKIGTKKQLIDNILKQADIELKRKMLHNTNQKKLLLDLQEKLGLDRQLKRIEIYDNSHISGSNAIGAMVVANEEGFAKSQYRKFDIKSKDINPGDDYAMMYEVLGRRFRNNKIGDFPDLVIIDGGQGQLNIVQQVFQELKLEGVELIAIAKGPDRNAGKERFFMVDREVFSLEPDSKALYFIQRLRDEAHRFAITTHRNKRTKNLTTSPIDEIPNIGAIRKKALLAHFGSGKEVTTATIEEIKRVDGISENLAKNIYEYFHL